MGWRLAFGKIAALVENGHSFWRRARIGVAAVSSLLTDRYSSIPQGSAGESRAIRNVGEPEVALWELGIGTIFALIGRSSVSPNPPKLGQSWVTGVLA